MSPRLAAIAAASLAAAGCVTPARLAGPPPAPADAVVAGFAPSIRGATQGFRTPEDLAENLSRLRGAVTDGSLDILALSGGGAGGAFGAGALVGLTEAGRRPAFEVVTGVSTGALIAPFAFLGAEWDRELEEAYTGPLAENLLRRRGFSVLTQPGLFLGDPLRDLVDHFVTGEMIAAVAREARRGRLLLVQTTNLDTQDPVIWNLGEIAQRGGEPARALFRDVLVASASVPGVFPPVMMDVEADGARMQEMHVDGGVTSSFFVMPQLIAMWSDDQMAELRGGNIYVIVNGQLDNRLNATPLNTVPIVSRSFETSQMFQARATLALTEDFARRNRLALRFTRIPRDYDFLGPLEFERAAMRTLFDFGKEQARAGRLWSTPADFVEQLAEPAPASRPDGENRPLR
ncbi:MAG: patatin-like phospholipase family protein [Hyphomonadaceae bacterium]|nr:patatin-like phospholipase family protein [Hyphomonadaceae bacterium]